ncbi:unnamed protein product [Protopolystoma xenopodis]|uniref:glycerol-3-phosphate dehydrogenase n=1 Tax=Protopolystoma xenopodis TaxID=117903 RepID=A0A3S5AXW6_9PLAT|nr:unnamed protein product [Protopolystoma xenopodis]
MSFTCICFSFLSFLSVRREDVHSAWSGIRPLVIDPYSKNTQSLARNHIIEVSKTNLITIAGGKWTTYRSMAEETLDKAIKVCGLQPASACRTRGLLLEGAHLWSPNLSIKLLQEFGFQPDVAQHLARTYGDKAFKIAQSTQPSGKRWPVTGTRLHPDFPYLESEVCPSLPHLLNLHIFNITP